MITYKRQWKDSKGNPIQIFAGRAGANNVSSFIFREVDDTVIDISTGFTITMIAKVRIIDPDANAVFGPLNGTITDGPAGKFTIDLFSENISTTAAELQFEFRNTVSGKFTVMGILYADVVQVTTVAT